MGKDIVIFDLHGTLADSRVPISDKMAGYLKQLLKVKILAVVSGSTYQQFETELLKPLGDCDFSRLSLFPSEATEFYSWYRTWHRIYAIELMESEIQKIREAFNKVCRAVGFLPKDTFGETLMTRGGQVTYSALGFDAPLEAKKGWDISLAKRLVLKDKLAELLPNYDISIGGFTSVNVNHKGMGKVNCIKEMCRRNNCNIDSIFYVGNEFYEGGDDLPVKEMGVDCAEVTSPLDTEALIGGLLDDRR